LTDLLVAALASEGLAVLAAWALVVQDRAANKPAEAAPIEKGAASKLTHKPAAWALTLLFLAHVIRAPVQNALTPQPEAPWEGAARLLVYLDGALVFASIAIVPGLACAVFLSPGRRRAGVRLVAVAWALASIVLAALYPAPIVRTPSLGSVYLAAELAGLFVALAVFIPWARWAKGRESPGSAQGIGIALWVLDLATLVTPYAPRRRGFFPAPVEVIQIEIIVIFAAIAAVEGILWRLNRR
jgi:hypothetical protein